jgi:hypothetical protein
MLRAITALLQEKNINDLVCPLKGMGLIVGAVKEDYKTVYDVEFVANVIESADFSSFIVGHTNDVT